MAGIYIHIPFCKTRCIYCGFYSTTLHELQDKYVDAVLEELSRSLSPSTSLIKESNMTPTYAGENIRTIYIGGGTPSQLSHENLRKLIQGVFDRIGVSLSSQRREKCPEKEEELEFTVECNPDDVTPELATLLYYNGVNRVSMGVQSFSDERLRFIHRRHSAEQARNAVNILRNTGITNISIDLMFGFPEETLDDWDYDIAEALKLNVPHISAYSLMYEEGTPLYKMLERGDIQEIDEELSRKMYYHLIDRLEDAGYEHYEISNFAKPGFRSKHNSSYWHEVPYLGLGAGAHSYDLITRSFNTTEIPHWHHEVEELDEITRYNDRITTALRTKEGLEIKNDRFKSYLLENARPLIDKGLLAIDNNHLHLTHEGLYVSDDVMSELIFID